MAVLDAIAICPLAYQTLTLDHCILDRARSDAFLGKVIASRAKPWF
jgi:hypothetical protein